MSRRAHLARLVLVQILIYSLAFVGVIAVGRRAAIDDGADLVADDLNDAVVTAQTAARGHR